MLPVRQLSLLLLSLDEAFVGHGDMSLGEIVDGDRLVWFLPEIGLRLGPLRSFPHSDFTLRLFGFSWLEPWLLLLTPQTLEGFFIFFPCFVRLKMSFLVICFGLKRAFVCCPSVFPPGSSQPRIFISQSVVSGRCVNSFRFPSWSCILRKLPDDENVNPRKLLVSTLLVRCVKFANDEDMFSQIKVSSRELQGLAVERKDPSHEIWQETNPWNKNTLYSCSYLGWLL